MKRVLLSLNYYFLITLFLCGPASVVASNNPENFIKSDNSRKGFIENKGQIIDQDNKPNPAVLYLLHTPGLNVQLRKGGFSYDLYQLTSPPAPLLQESGVARHASRVTRCVFHRIDFDLLNSNPAPAVETSEPSSDYTNYYTTGTPVEGATSVRSYRTVTYKNIYPGIDLQFIADDEKLFEYNFIIQPGGDINSIKLNISGPQRIKKYQEGLRFKTTIGEVDEMIPVCFYSFNGSKVPVNGRFRKIDQHLYGISVDSPVPPEAVLVIDPIPSRLWGTYFGGEGYDVTIYGSSRNTKDGEGGIYICGLTYSISNIATSGAYQTNLQGTTDLFLARFRSSGQILWATYYGGEGQEGFSNCARDGTGNIYLSGETASSTGIATTGSYQSSLQGPTDAFLVKFNKNGTRIWATYYGGELNEDGRSCITDGHDNIYLCGTTQSTTGISTPGAYKPNLSGGCDAFLVKFDSTGSRQWGTYFGGSAIDEGWSCAADTNGHIVISGVTYSNDGIATPGAQQFLRGGNEDGFLALFTDAGLRSWGTYYGGTGDDVTIYCTMDNSGNIYTNGETSSLTNIASPGSYQNMIGGMSDGFLAKFNLSGARQWGTYYGGTQHEVAMVSCIDDSSNVFLGGYTSSSTGIATPGAFHASYQGGTNDAFLVKFNAAGVRQWGTYYGGEGQDGIAGISTYADTIFISGYTQSLSGIATPGAYQTEYGGGLTDFQIAKFVDCNGPDTAGQITGPASVCQGSLGVGYSINPIPGVTGYHWSTTPGITITNGQNTTAIVVSFSGGFISGQIMVQGVNACSMGEIRSFNVTGLPEPVPVITGFSTCIIGNTYTFTTSAGMSNYQWTISAGGNVVGGGTTSDNTIQVQWTVAGAQWVRVNYTDVNGCTAPNPSQKNIWVTTSPVVVDFSSPDTVCTGGTVNITNSSQGTTTYYWNFCSGDANTNPTGVNIGNPGGLLSVPTYLTLVRQNDSCFSFISCQGVGVIRYYHGSSFANNPVSWTNLGTFGLIGPNEEGIQVKFDDVSGNWYGFVNSNTTIIRLNFGNSLMNTPTAVDLLLPPMYNMAHGLVILKEGANWLGFVTCSTGASLNRLDFGTSLANPPSSVNFGSLGGVLISPAAICFVQENSLWYAMVMAGGNTLARLTFGTSLTNIPTGVNLGNPGGFNSAGGLTLLRDCDATTGYWTNYLVNGELGKLSFPTGILGSVTGTVLGNIGGLARPHSFSELFRQNDTLFAYITNRDNGTLTRLTFPPCNNASVPFSTLFNPPPFSYNSPGTYNIHLIADEGLPTMESLCKPVVVMDPMVLNLGTDKSICPGNSTVLDAGAGFSSYLWSNSATTRTITVTAPGTYWVTGTRWGCSSSDTIMVNQLSGPSVHLGPDTTICSGQTITFDAGACAGCSYQWANLTLGQMNIGNGQTYTTGTAGNYRVTVVGPNSCMGRDTVLLSVNPLNSVGISILPTVNNVCAGTSVTFNALPINPGTNPVYQWYINGNPFGGNTSSYTYIPVNGDVVTCRLTSNINCPANNPAMSAPVTMNITAPLAVTVTISASPNPFCTGNSVTFSATPGNGGGLPTYQWYVNAIWQATTTGVFVYVPAGGDIVNCILTSSLTCVTGNPATSNSITMMVNPGLPAGITIAASSNPFCPGAAVTFSATPINGGPTPSYLWKVNGGTVGGNSSSYTYNPITGDSVRCIMQSDLLCVTGNPVSSIKIVMSGTLAPLVTFTPCFDTITTLNAKPIKLKGGIPLGGTYSGPGVNPVTGILTPSLAGIGTKTISYSYTNVSLCTSTSHLSIVISPSSLVNCGNPITDIRDNKVYTTIQIGGQCWFTEDLNYGTEIPFVQYQRDNCIAEKYHNPASSIQHPASVYQWDELMQYDDTPAEQGFCPPGWHVPTENDWLILFLNYTSSSMAASPLKYSGYSGFNALLSGSGHLNKNWDYPGFATFYWSSTSHGPIKAWAHGMNDPDPSVSSYPSLRTNAFSVRCIKD